MTPTISFVIPTLNFATFLPDTLNSIVEEGYSSIEIVVFDGRSTDNTMEVLEDYRAKFPALRVVVAAERGNIDIDLNQAVAAATGDYVWTMSADDALIPGWSRIVVDRLGRREPDLMLVPAVHCDISMRPRREYPILRAKGGGELLQTIAKDEDLIAYLAKIRTSEGLFSFCSACLVRRDKLLRAPTLDQANGTCWRYSARLISVLTNYPSTILVLDKPLLLKRGDNDSFSHAGVIRRLRIATTNWDDAIDLLTVGYRLRRSMKTRVKSDIRPTSLLYLSQFVRDAEEQVIYDQCVDSRLGSGNARQRWFGKLLKRLPQLTILKRGLLIARPIYRELQRRLWEARLPLEVHAPASPRSVASHSDR